MVDRIWPLDIHEPKWYALFLRTNQEKTTAQHLAARGVEHYLPSYRTLRQRKDRRVQLDTPLFPSYIFVHLPFIERMTAITTPHVISMVGSGGEAFVIPDAEILSIQRAASCGAALPHNDLKAGCRVVIARGILAGLEGFLVRYQSGVRVVVSVTSIGRAFAVNVDASCVRSAMSAINRVPACETFQTQAVRPAQLQR